MASDINRLLEELQTLSVGEKRRVREAINRQLTESANTSSPPAAQLSTLQQLREELRCFPVRNPSDGFSNRDHDEIVYGGDT